MDEAATGWFCAWSVNHGGNDIRDFYEIHPMEAAKARYHEVTKTISGLHCVCAGPIAMASEPHWLEADSL